MKLKLKLFSLALLVLLFSLSLVVAQSKSKKIDFEASTIVGEILGQVGSMEFNTSNSCQILETKLVKIYENIACQKAADIFSDAQDEIDEIMAKYKIKAISEWLITEQGASRIFVSEGQKELQSINVFVTNNLVLLGY